ncbi:MAG: DUF86 domain-containing protein, partial [Holosporaceae bacterium]|nr:DUF86 domain-containing protein [Holosporaceae bacterium]
MKNDLLYVNHVVETAEIIMSYVNEVSLDDFLENRMLCDAVMRNLQILSESTQKISEKTKGKYKNIPWKDIAGFRNILVHDYLEGIDLIAVWNVIIQDLPKLYEEFLIIKYEIPSINTKNVEFLDEERDKLEKMDEFFTSRLNEYDEHMLNIEELPEAYRELAQLIPSNTQTLLDLGCGTGLELEEIFKFNPNIHVTGIDMTPAMIDRLREKYPDKNITLFCANYLYHDFGKEKYDVAVSFETMHHLSQEEKIKLYANISQSLKPNGKYIECDYMVDTQEEEDRYFAENQRLRAEQNIPDGEFYH